MEIAWMISQGIKLWYTTQRRLALLLQCLVNQQRTRRGLPSLAVSAQLDRSAQGWTNTMVLSGQFTHGPGDAFARRITSAGYVWQTAGENIAAGVWTTDLSNAHRLAAMLQAGSVYVNCWGEVDPGAPFGGYKASGLGREHGREGLDAYLETKTVWTKVG